MNDLTYIKNAIEKLYQINPNIHISVDIPRPRITVEKTSAVITGVYRNFFQIEEYDRGCPTRHTVQYGDVLIGHVVIEELYESLK